MAELSTHVTLQEAQRVCLGQQVQQACTAPQTHSQACLFAVHTWRPIEQDAPGRGQVEALKELWVDEGQEHHLLQGLDVVLQAPYLIKAD